MAEAFFNKYSGKDVAKSAALEETQDHMHRLVINAMKEEGIDLSDNLSKMVSPGLLEKADHVIFMNRNLEDFLDKIKSFLKKEVIVEFWDIPDVFARESDDPLYVKFIDAREIIKSKVEELINKLEA
jgi:protein-tyrosine-phosphatase